MKTLLIVAALAAALASPSLAEPRYDLKLERAVKDIVARKIRLEDMRGGFSYSQSPALVSAAPAAAVKTGVVRTPAARKYANARTPSILILDPDR